MSRLTQIPRLTPELYQQWSHEANETPGAFWAKMANDFLDFDKSWDTINTGELSTGEIKWFEGAQLNVCVNALDRHLATQKDKVALIFEGDDPAQQSSFTFESLFEQVCQMANTLKAIGVKKGDRVCLYLPMIPMTAISMLACARIGAVHTVVFGGFSPSALRDRILDAQCQYIITSDESRRGGKKIPLKANVVEALQESNPVTTVLVVKNTGNNVPMDPLRDVWYHDVAASQKHYCPAEKMAAEDPLFILYTSGSTGKPKGILHTTAGYALYSAMTFRWAFDYQSDDVFWCTADAGWITGHTYSLYGPLLNGATTLWFEGVPTYPSASRSWEIVDKHNVTIFYTAPTAIRALMAQGNAFVENTSRKSLRMLGSVGEPINTEAWNWYHDVVGNGECYIVDTWWQTETGGIMLAPFPGIAAQKPGAACLPFFGVQPLIVDDEGQVLTGEAQGHLVIQNAWPGMMRTVYNHHDRFVQSYLSKFPGLYHTGDGAQRDDEGDITITGRVDDVVNVSGHRLGTAEIESALVSHSDVAESAVVGVPHDIKGQSLYAFVKLMNTSSPSASLEKELRQCIEHHIGKFATCCEIQLCIDLPKTRSGKIMRRILRAIANDQPEHLGDTSTLANPEILKSLMEKHKPLAVT